MTNPHPGRGFCTAKLYGLFFDYSLVLQITCWARCLGTGEKPTPKPLAEGNSEHKGLLLPLMGDICWEA